MTNLERLKMVVNQIQFMIDEGIIDEEHCGMIHEEVYSAMEILLDCDILRATAFHSDMMIFNRLKGGEAK